MAFKVIKCGDVIEIYEYEVDPMQPKKAETDGDGVSGDEYWMGKYLLEGDEFYAEKLKERSWLHEVTIREKRRSNGNAARANFRRLVLANFTGKTNFITLTFRDRLDDGTRNPLNIRNVSETNKVFDQFMKRLRRAYGPDFKYAVVIEFQDENRHGVVHYHMLADLGLSWRSEEECRQMERDFAEKLWKQGFVDLKDVNHVDNLGAYMSKYMAKRMDDQRLAGKKAYRTSQNLVRPEILRGGAAEDLIAAYGLDEKKEVFANSYISEYLGKISYREYNLKRL